MIRCFRQAIAVTIASASCARHSALCLKIFDRLEFDERKIFVEQNFDSTFFVRTHAQLIMHFLYVLITKIDQGTRRRDAQCRVDRQIKA